jgi:hypothetical protein
MFKSTFLLNRKRNQYEMRFVLKILGIFAALLSAWFWLASARIDTPTTFHITVTSPGTVSPGDNALVGVGHSPSLTLLGQRLALQSKLNAWAAGAAACAIILMEVLPPIWEVHAIGRTDPIIPLI